MNLLSPVCLTFVVMIIVTTHRQRCNGDYWDGVPVISQIKSLVHVIRGDSNSARVTQENFLDQAPVVSQIKSIVQAAHGDGQGAVDTQMKFLRDKESAVDGLPLVDHAQVVAAAVSGLMYGVSAVVFGSSAGGVYGREKTSTKSSVDEDYVFSGNYRITRYRGGNYEKAAVQTSNGERVIRRNGYVVRGQFAPKPTSRREIRPL